MLPLKSQKKICREKYSQKLGKNTQTVQIKSILKNLEEIFLKNQKKVDVLKSSSIFLESGGDFFHGFAFGFRREFPREENEICQEAGEHQERILLDYVLKKMISLKILRQKIEKKTSL